MTVLLALIIGLLSWGLTALLPILPWYTPVIVAFLAGLATAGYKSVPFLAGFLGVGIFWALAALWSHWQNGGIASGRVAALFSGEMGLHVTPLALLIITPLIGALLGGAAALSGQMLAGQGASNNRYARRHRNERRRKSYKLRIQ